MSDDNVQRIVAAFKPRIVGHGEFALSAEHAREHLVRLEAEPPSAERDARLAVVQAVLVKEQG